MEFVKKTNEEVIVYNNGKVIKDSKIQSYEDNQKKIIKGEYDGHPFMLVKNKKQFRPVKHVSFRIKDTKPLYRTTIERTLTPYYPIKSPTSFKLKRRSRSPHNKTKKNKPKKVYKNNKTTKQK
jgi:hypothetical protein